MADREQSLGTKRRMEEKTRGDWVPRGDELIGGDVPDESKERHTEIAVEAGRKGGAPRKKKG